MTADRPEGACPGYCCAAFTYPRTLSQIRRDPPAYDGEMIADMLIPLTPKQARERYERFGGPAERSGFRWKSRGHHFTCRHWDEETRLCTVYEDRPAMCRDYPYGQECQHGCGRVGGLPSEERMRIREERWANQWKAYEAPKPAERLP